MAALADAVRDLIETTVTNDAPSEVLERVLDHLQAADELLCAHVPAQPHPRFVDPASARPADAGEPHHAVLHGSMPYDPVIGRFNPLALPISITFEPPLAVGSARFTTAYEGGPGWVHGAAIAGTFDIVLTAANQLAGAAGPTVWLTVRFRRPTLVGVDARFEAEVVSNDGRRVVSRGRLVQDGTVTAEGEGEFAVVPASKLLKQRSEKP